MWQNKIFQKLQSIDRYGTQITLTLDKKQKFTTAFGGCLSIITWMCALGYLGYCLYRVDSHEYQMASIDGYKGDLLDINHNLTGHFDAAFQVQYAGSNMDVHRNIDTYFTMYVQQLAQSTDEATGRPKMTTLQEYNMMPCTDERFGAELINEARSLGISKYWCMNETELHIQNGKKLIAVYFDYCNQTFLDIMHPGKGMKCKTIAQINDEIPFIALFRYFKNSFLDYNEFDKNPVKGVLRNKIHQLFANKTIHHTVLATRHTAYLKDDKFSNYGGDTEHIFYDFDSVKMELIYDYNPYEKFVGDYFPNGLPLLKLDFEINVYFTKKYRKVMTVLDAVAQTGGIMGVLVGFGAILNGLFQSALFKIQMIGLLYTTTNYQKQNKNDNFANFSKDVEPFNSMRGLIKINNESNNSNEKQTINASSTSNSIIGEIINKIISRKPLLFDKWLIIRQEILSKIYFCRKDINQKFKTYTQADLKMNYELDVVNLIKKMRQVDVLTKILVNINQQNLIKFGEDSSINLNESSLQINENDSKNIQSLEQQLGKLAKQSEKQNNAKQLMQLLSGQELHNSAIPISSIEKLSGSFKKIKKNKSQHTTSLKKKSVKYLQITSSQVNCKINESRSVQKSDTTKKYFEEVSINSPIVKRQKHKHRQFSDQQHSLRSVNIEQCQAPKDSELEERIPSQGSKLSACKYVIKISE
eukprot:403356683